VVVSVCPLSKMVPLLGERAIARTVRLRRKLDPGIVADCLVDTVRGYRNAGRCVRTRPDSRSQFWCQTGLNKARDLRGGNVEPRNPEAIPRTHRPASPRIAMFPRYRRKPIYRVSRNWCRSRQSAGVSNGPAASGRYCRTDRPLRRSRLS
jgi:hypothetical protein